MDDNRRRALPQSGTVIHDLLGRGDAVRLGRVDRLLFGHLAGIPLAQVQGLCRIGILDPQAARQAQTIDQETVAFAFAQGKTILTRVRHVEGYVLHTYGSEK